MSEQDRAAWLASLKVGDEVVTERQRGFEEIKVLAKVEKVRTMG